MEVNTYKKIIVINGRRITICAWGFWINWGIWGEGSEHKRV
jgi:hypothetical protein